jgi:beta-lactamase regulating signal transducer with metallopeptidase domain/predicted  nucleic acid-binding Zn-ribbon protein
MTASVVLVLKASLLLAAALAIAACFQRQLTALIRHRLWSGVFAAVLLLPALTVMLPVLHVPLPDITRWSASPSFAARVFSGSDAGASGDAKASIDTKDAALTSPVDVETRPGLVSGTESRSHFLEATRSRPSVSVIVVAMWLVGTLVSVLAVMIALARVSRLARRATVVADAAWLSVAEETAARVGARTPRLLHSVEIASPMAGGFWRPTVFLPSSFTAWTPERRDVVLAHEIVHLAAQDPVRHLIARLAMALYWFHPLAWMAARRSAIAREQACDEAVLALGTRPSAYARVLLELAESTDLSPMTLGALPMAQRSHLETRLMAILTDDIRPAGARRLQVPAVVLAVLTLTVAAAQPSARSVTPAWPAGETRVETVSAPELLSAPAAAPLALGSPLPAAQSRSDRDSACSWSATDSRYFQGSISSSNRDGGTQVYRQVGRRGEDRIIQWAFGDLRVCMVAEGAGDDEAMPSRLVGSARRVVLETRSGAHQQRLEVARDGGSTWSVDGRDRAIDGPAREWRERMLAVLDGAWELSNLRGRVSSLRGEISSVRGEESSLRGQISSLQGEVSSMRGEISSVQGHESSLRGRISSIRGQESSLRGAISSEQGAISSLNASRYGSDSADRSRIDSRIRDHEAAIKKIEAEIRNYDADGKVAQVEQEIRVYDSDGKVAAIERELRDFDLNGKVAAVNSRIKSLDVAGKVAAIEKEIDALDADRRSAAMEDRLDDAAKRLKDTVASIR